VEYAYGKHDRPSSGIFEVLPRRCPGYAFREPVLVGTRDLTRAEVCALKAELAKDFTGDAYNLCPATATASATPRPHPALRQPTRPKIRVVFTWWVIPGDGRAPAKILGEFVRNGVRGTCRKTKPWTLCLRSARHDTL
jgi:deubiquitinase DESI2